MKDKKTLYEWAYDMPSHPSSHTVTGTLWWRTNGSAGEQGVLFLEGLPELAPGIMLLDIETHLCMVVVRMAENGALCVKPLYSSPLKWWQVLACRVFRLQDERVMPPCVNHGSTVIEMPESHYEGENVPHGTTERRP